jgi:hypothetical protein
MQCRKKINALVLLDGDGQHNPREIPLLIEPLKNDTADFVIGFRALNRKTIDVFTQTLKEDDFAIESEMLRTAHDLQLRLADVKINSKYGNFDTSSKNLVSHGFSVLGSVIYLIAEKRPLVYIGLPGLVLMLIGFFFALLLLQQYNQTGYFSIPFTMLAGFFIVIGVLGIFIGLVLNVISRVLQKVK